MTSDDVAIRLIQDMPELLGIDLDQKAQFVNRRLRRIARFLDRIDDQTIRQFEDVGIKTADDVRTMGLLLQHRDTGLTNSELLSTLGGSKAGVSSRLHRLTSYGNVVQSTSVRDRRYQTNVLSPAGVDVAQRLLTMVFQERDRVLSSIDKDRLDRLSHLLDEIIQEIDPDA